MPGLFIIAHAPLASALKLAAQHCFPEAAQSLQALDVQPNLPADEVEAQARLLLAQALASDARGEALVMTDVFGATPCNVAQKLVDGVSAKLVTGVNLPMLLRTVCYRNESLDALVTRALNGATQGIMQVAITAPQNQQRRRHDPDTRDHQQ